MVDGAGDKRFRPVVTSLVVETSIGVRQGRNTGGVGEVPFGDVDTDRRIGVGGTILAPRELPTDPVLGAKAALKVGQWNREGGLLVTSNSVRDVLESGDLSSIEPPIPRPMWPMATMMIRALSLEGPLGSRGALGPKGLAGDDPINPSFWMQRIGDWSGFAKALTELGGPMSGLGSLGAGGPLTPEAIEALKLFGPIAAQLGPGGLFAALGPTGALGAASILGAGGIMGGHGFASDDDGNFVDKDGATVSQVGVRYEGNKRDIALTELYTDDHLEGSASQDAAFMVRGTLSEDDPQDDFRFTSKHEQFVTLTVVPETLDRTYYLDLFDGDGNHVGTADLDDGVNYIQLQVPEGQELVARVRRGPDDATSPYAHPFAMLVDAMLAPLEIGAAASRGWMKGMGMIDDEPSEPGYRLIVTPSTEQIADTELRGAHQTTWRPER